MASLTFEELIDGHRDRWYVAVLPWNGYAERSMVDLVERLDDVVVFGEWHLRHVLVVMVTIRECACTYRSTRMRPYRARSRGQGVSAPSNPGRAASPIVFGLICDRHNVLPSSVRQIVER